MQAADLKGHTGTVFDLDFSQDGKYLASCSADRTVRIWNVKDFLDKEHKYVRANVEFDHAKAVSISPDSRAIVTCIEDGNHVRVFKINRKKDGTGNCSDVVDFPKEHESPIISAQIASTGRFIMTCYSDTTFIIWNLKGEILAREDTNQVKNHYACISPCGRFVACTGFTPDVKLWEVAFSKSGDFEGVTRAMDLKGHKAAVYCCAFSKDSTRAATVSKDGSWKFWNQDVQYKLKQDPSLLHSIEFQHSGPALIALSPDGLVAAIASSASISIYCTSDGSLATQLDSVHTDAITGLVWDPIGRYLASSGGNDKHVKVWHNVPGYKALIDDCKKKVPVAKSQALKERLMQQVKDAEQALTAIAIRDN